MGRYYQGDIEGKFWFGIQSSDDADHFGDIGEPNEINYYFDKDDHLDNINEGIKKCLKGLGDWKDEMLWDQIKLNKVNKNKILKLYARLELGNQIKECVEKKGACSFSAEL